MAKYYAKAKDTSTQVIISAVQCNCLNFQMEDITARTKTNRFCCKVQRLSPNPTAISNGMHNHALGDENISTQQRSHHLQYVRCTLCSVITHKPEQKSIQQLNKKSLQTDLVISSTSSLTLRHSVPQSTTGLSRNTNILQPLRAGLNYSLLSQISF